jgi:hypothetical protein
MKTLITTSISIAVLFGLIACKKTKSHLPEDAHFLLGNWKLINTTCDAVGGTPVSEPPMDYLSISEKKLLFTLSTNEVYKGVYSVMSSTDGVSQEPTQGKYLLRLEGSNRNNDKVPFISHRIMYSSDTLLLYNTIMDAGCSYKFVKD